MEGAGGRARSGGEEERQAHILRVSVLLRKPRLNLFYVNILYDISVQSESRFADFEHEGWIFLMHPDKASGNHSHRAQSIQPLVGFGRDKDNTALVP